MRQLLWSLWRSEGGQDLIEYVLLLAFVAIGVAGLFAFNEASIHSIASGTNNRLDSAANAAAN